MISVTALEAKTRFGEPLDRVDRGEEIVITRHERPVARMVPEVDRKLSSSMWRPPASLHQCRASTPTHSPRTRSESFSACVMTIGAKSGFRGLSSIWTC